MFSFVGGTDLQINLLFFSFEPDLTDIFIPLVYTFG